MTNNAFGQHYIASYRQWFLIFCKITIDNLTFPFVFDFDIQVAYTIALSKETEDREYRPLESIKDNYPRYVVTTDYLLQQRSGIRNVNLIDFICKNEKF